MISLLAASSGCALLTKSTPVVPRYFTPEAGETPPVAAVPRSPLAVRVGRVGGDSYLRERMVYRGADQEVGYHEDRRWTERPEVYLARALETSLFEEHGLTRAVSWEAPTVTAELTAFEEVTGGAPRVRLRITYALADEAAVYLERTVTVERPLPDGPEVSRPSRVAAALGLALHEAVGRIALDVAASLEERRARGG
jgi:cholesterol transport system auxiliary component